MSSSPEPYSIHISTERIEYDPELFKGRSEVLDRVQAHLDQARANELTRPLIEIVGVTWIGKTWLLSEIQECYKKESSRKIRERPTCACYLDLHQLEQEDPSEADVYRWYTRFLKSLTPALEKASGERRPHATNSLPESQSELPFDLDEVQEVLNSLKQWFRKLHDHYFPILLLDSTEKIHPVLLEWVEREILVPFVEGNQALIITAGRRPVKWRAPEIRFYSDLICLGPLEEPAWGKHVPKWIHEQYAFGHPGLAWKLNSAFQGIGANFEQLRTLHQKPEEERAVIGPVLKTAISTIVLFEVPMQDIPRQQMNLQSLLWTISVLRTFNPELLKAMVDEFGPEVYRGKSYMFFRQAAFNLIGCNVVAWRAALNDYRVEPIVRRIMANALRIADGRDEYLKRHHMAEDWYRTALQSAPSTAANKLPELLYHYCIRVKLETPKTLSDKAILETRSLTEVLGLRESQVDVDMLLQRLTNEEDEDLKELRQDMIDVVDQITYKEIVNVLQETLADADVALAL